MSDNETGQKIINHLKSKAGKRLLKITEKVSEEYSDD